MRVVLGATLPLLAAVLLSCTSQTKDSSSATTPAGGNPWGERAAVSFDQKKPAISPVGSEACTPCHTDIAQKHKGTNHALTLYTATLGALKDLAPPEGELRPGMALRHRGDTLAVEVKNPETGKQEQLSLALALGSGKTGLTFLTHDGDTTIEISRSYFPHDRVWHITPGQEMLDPNRIGVPHEEAVTRKCLSCHAVTSPEQPMIPDPKFFGVGCESCHGPGSTHVGGAKLADLKKLDGDGMNALCGRCHRTAADVKAMGKIALDSTNRFQPYAMTLTKCFTKSQGKLTCITCHNPHENASKDIPKYERTCVACHDGSVKTKPVCPVNAKQGCVKCHMPTRNVFPSGSKIPIAMADHFIRVFKK